MSPTHLHLMLNHIPVLGTVFGVALLLLALWRKSEELKRVALSAFVVVALLTIPSYLTGEPAEDGIKGLPGVSSPIIEKHEKAGGVALTGSLILGVGALACLLWFRAGRRIPTSLSVGILSVALAVSGITAWTANLGGQVRHTEIRSNAGAPLGDSDRHHE